MKNKSVKADSNERIKSQPIRILHFIGSLDIGGSQTMIMNIYRNIDRSKIQFDFVIDRKNETFFKKEIESYGGKVYVLDEYFKGYNYVQYVKQWKNFFKNNPEYKILHCHVRSVASIVLGIAKKNGLKTICHSHNTSNGKGLKAVVKKYLQNKIKKNCDYYFACSKESARWLYGEDILDDKKCIIINNAIDSSKYVFNEGARKKVRKTLGLEDKLILGQVGRIETVKNYSFSLDLLKELLRDDDRYHLLVVGTGSMKNDILKKAKDLGIEKSFTILENRSDVNELMQAMDVFIMPSLWEGLPVALVEAQAVSLPCVVSENIGDGIIDSGLVNKIDISSIEKWRQKIVSILRDNNVRKDNSKKIKESGFDIREGVKLISDFYFSLARMKIFFCLGSIGHGGAERVVSNLSNFFVKENDVAIIVTKKWEPGYDLDRAVNHFVLDEMAQRESFLARTVYRIRVLRGIIKKESPDIIIAFLPEPSFRLMVAKAFLPVKTIISVRNDPNVEYDNYIKRLLVKVLYTKADGFVFQTPDAREWFPKKIRQKSVIIPNLIDEKFFCEPYTGKREKTVVNVGRLVEQKNQKLLIDAFYEFRKVHSDYRLKIYGDGPLKNELKEQIERLELVGSVKLMGEVFDIKKEIYKAGMFVLTSDYEGMPNALMEAMALGVPCISTDCPIGGPRFLIRSSDYGLLVKTGSENEVKNAMEKIGANHISDCRSFTGHHQFCNLFISSKISGAWRRYIIETCERGKQK